MFKRQLLLVLGTEGAMHSSVNVQGHLRDIVELTEQPFLLSRSPNHGSPASHFRTSHGNRVAS